MIKDKIQSAMNIACWHRRTGCTTWILKSAIKYPNCIILSPNKEISQHNKREYFKLLKKYPFYIKAWWIIKKRKHPIFCSVDDAMILGCDLPIVFDNSIFTY